MNFIEQSADILALFLFISFALSLPARRHWFFSLMAQFTLQYFYGALILLTVHLFFGNFQICVLLAGIAAACFIRTQRPLTRVYKTPDISSKFSIALHNKYYHNGRYGDIYREVKDHDIVILVEAVRKDEGPLHALFKETHPHSLPEGAKRPDFVLPFSKYKIDNLAYKKLAPDTCFTQGFRFTVHPDGCPDPMTIYTLHAETPLGRYKSTIQKAELSDMAEWIKEDTAEHNWQNIIFAGDWNTTPFVPMYDDLLSVSGLQNQVFGLFPVCTWPSFLLFRIFKIPIDHILVGGNLTLTNIKNKRSNGSDHHSLIAHFDMKP